MFVHGAELVIYSICNDATATNPATVEDIIDDAQWLANMASDYSILWVNHFCNLDYQVVCQQHRSSSAASFGVNQPA